MSLKIDRVQLEIVIQQDSARQQMIQLEEKMRSATKTLGALKKQFGENSEAYKNQEAIVKGLRAEYDKLFEGIGIGSLSLKELQNRQKELNAILRNLPGDSSLFTQYDNQLREVNARIKELKGTADMTKFSLSKLADGFNKYAAIGAGAIASLTGMALTARKCVDEFAQMQEAESQVRKYTGMTTEEVAALNEEFKKMDTRTARTRLNELAGEAGRLGMTGKQDVLEFVEAANMIDVSLGEDLGEDGIKNIGKLAQMFGDSSRSMKDNMLAIGSSVNEVAQNSSAAEPYLVEFTARMGGVAKQAKLSVTDVMGFASALDQNMLRSEMASTALQGLILKLYQEPAKYAKLAGMDVEQFTKLMETDANEAMLAFLGSLGKLGSMDKMAPVLKEMKLSGAEAAGVISALAGNVEKVRKEQETANRAFIDGTSAQKEYSIQNSTVQAELDKAKQRFVDIRVALGERLMPLMKHMISTGSMTVKGLTTVVSVLMEYKGAILTTGTAILAYTAYIKAGVIVTKAYELATKAATFATNLFSKATKASPWGLVIAGVTAVISYFAFYKSKTDEVTDSQRKFNAELEKTKETMDLIAGVKLNAENFEFLTEGQKQQMKSDAKRAIEQLDDLLTKGMIATKKWYTEEQASIIKATEGNEILRHSYLRNLEHDFDARTKKLGEYVDKKKELEKIISMVPDIKITPNTSGEEITDKELNKREEKIRQAMQLERNLWKDDFINKRVTEEEYNQVLYDTEISFLTSKKELLIKHGRDVSEVQGQIYDAMIAEANRLDKAKTESDKKNQTKELKVSDDKFEKDKAKLKQQYLSGEIKKEKDFQDQMKSLEVQYLEERKRTLERWGEDTTKISAQIQDAKLGQKKDEKEEKKDAFIGEIENTSNYDRKLSLLKAMYDADLINYQEYEKQKKDITEDYEDQREKRAQATFDVIGEAARAASEIVGALQDRELRKVSAKYDKQIASAKKAGKDTTKLEAQKEEEMSQVKKKYADKQFAATVLQVIATTASAAMNSYNSMSVIPIVGPALGAIAAAAAVASGAAQIGVAKQARDEAKGLKTGGYSDEYVQGYTASGNPDDTAGVIPVHKNEFVTNHEGVANPHVRQFLDVFDIAQKNGTIRMLNTTQILEHIRTRTGKYSGGWTNEGSSGTSSANMVMQANGGMNNEQMVGKVLELMRESNRLLDIISKKELNIDSRKVRDGIRRVDQLERNVSR